MFLNFDRYLYYSISFISLGIVNTTAQCFILCDIILNSLHLLTITSFPRRGKFLATLFYKRLITRTPVVGIFDLLFLKRLCSDLVSLRQPLGIGVTSNVIL